ncbi:AmmeMemoRadiSam system radical SAM enzyme [Candidatus Nitrosotalea sp. TS]|uniref:AmmeMemoRadiSam system radical SAM enzyme n=1 Tax=Candidatus Nitrosotalea sp. TS TaxID=2341020 RepID=UPI001409C8F9|nr:AmmeMemoRadiSam system radical SAM enzyme [Candidatus Nitrosotalea sp. TS]
MADGSKKSIEKITSGNKVWSYNVEGNFEIIPNVVTHTGSRFAELLEVRYGSRGHGKLYLTREHPVFTTRGWKTAETLERGDQIVKVWYQNTKVWKQKRLNSIQESKFSCKNCDQVIVGFDEWNRHRGVCYLKEYEMPKEMRVKYSARMKTNNPMYDPLVAKRSHETSKARFIEDPSHGWHKNAERLRKWLHKHPSESQKLLYDLLDRMSIKYEKEYRIKTETHTEGSKSFYIADAAIIEAKIDIEIDGWWHYNSEKIQQTDKIRDKALAANGWKTIRISGRQIYSHADEVEALIIEYVSPLVRKNKRTWVEVKQVKPTGKTTQVFSFECIPNHNYVGDGILLHNCKYCQNYDISQRRKIEGADMTPQEVVDMATSSGSQGIAYTYNQPSIFIEFARDCGVIARKNGLFNIFVSNGYDTPETVKMMDEFLDCITVDFKGNAEPQFTRKYIGVPDPQPIFDTLKEIRDKTRIHVEITDLVVPQVGDDLEHAAKLCKFVYNEFGPDMPIHFLRFHPDYKMMEFESTPIKTLEKHHEIAKKEGLNYAYLGNVPGHPLEHTYCSGCKKIVVKRYGFDIQGWHLDDNNNCKFCGNHIPIEGKLAENYKQNRFQFVF